ncbi:hypothetical protein [Pantoea sp. SORGH_AS_0659]|uniref:hypothetical protein n=1 Tax=Pantoea sp. SORGH_AS_0659 TaxID=3062597 RepID=UPI00285F3072|nr:hypothetical protein [Pantoea sp. SORGH_AS_0659]MDR6352522.1 chromosome segregation ATPase [Pantoea sp. SORGH_AS_0659]
MPSFPDIRLIIRRLDQRGATLDHTARMLRQERETTEQKIDETQNIITTLRAHLRSFALAGEMQLVDILEVRARSATVRRKLGTFDMTLQTLLLRRQQLIEELQQVIKEKSVLDRRLDKFRQRLSKSKKDRLSQELNQADEETEELTNWKQISK